LRITSGLVIRVGITAQGYPFPAPTGIADFSLRTAGDQPLLSAIATYGPVDNRQIELDGQIPLVPGRLGLAAGATYHITTSPLQGLHSSVGVGGGVLRWRPNAAVEIKPFYARIETWDDRSLLPLFFTAGPFLPSPIARHYAPLRWAAGRDTTEMAGVVASARLSPTWSVRAGLFHWRDDSRRSFQDLFEDVQPDGSARRSIVASRDQIAESISGELRSAWTLPDGPRRHILMLNLRGRSTGRSFGGADVLDLGAADIANSIQLAEPPLAFGPLSQDRVRQLTLGLGYQGVWQGVGGISLSVQRADYRKSSRRAPGEPAILSLQSPWLFGGGLMLTPSSRFSVYGGYTTGLEESGIAPPGAVNRNAAAPAIHTRQGDAGLRYRFGARLSLVAGIFDVRKPYINVDTASFYRQLGEERHRGVELSLAGQLSRNLSMVAGALFIDARVSGEAVDSGLIGPRPVGSTPRRLQLNLDWHLPFFDPLSLSFVAENRGPTVASAQAYASLAGRQLVVPGRTTIGLGARYRFRIADTPATLRVQADNLFNAGQWDVGGDSSFTFAFRRRFWFSIAVDISSHAASAGS